MQNISRNCEVIVNCLKVSQKDLIEIWWFYFFDNRWHKNRNWFLRLLKCQGIIQKKSVSGSWMLPCHMIFFGNFIWIWKCQKWYLNKGTLVSETVIYWMKCPFTFLSALFLFFWALPYDSRLSLECPINFEIL